MIHDTVGTRAVHHGVSQATLKRMAPSSSPMEASPLDLRSVTVIPRALLEVIRGDDENNNNPSCINSPLQTSPPRVVR